MVGLAESPEEYESKGFDTGRQAEVFPTISEHLGMPIHTRERPRMAATVPACRAVWPRGDTLPTGCAPCCAGFGFATSPVSCWTSRTPSAMPPATPVSTPRSWSRGWPSRRPRPSCARTWSSPAGRCPRPRCCDHKLANWSGGRRYTCPSYEITRLSDVVRIAVPGFQPFPVYDVATANLVPRVDRPGSGGVREDVLRWASPPATRIRPCCATSRRIRRTSSSATLPPSSTWVSPASGPWPRPARRWARARPRPRARPPPRA